MATRKAISERNQRRKRRLADPQGLNNTFRALRKPMAMPLTFLKDGQRLATTPDHLDASMAQAWDPIYRGNGDPITVASEFMGKYWKHIPQAPEIAKAQLTPRAALQGLRRSATGAPGADAWFPAELSNMPMIAARLPTAMCIACEAGAPWPEQLLIAKGIQLAKETAISFDPLKFRSLLVASAVYRTYGKIRLGQLSSWFEVWQCQQLFCGHQREVG